MKLNYICYQAYINTNNYHKSKIINKISDILLYYVYIQLSDKISTSTLSFSN